MTDSMDLALKIVALMDEFPTEPLSFERKQLELKLEQMISNHTQQVDSELQFTFEEGYTEGKESASDDYYQEIHELEEELDDVRRELEEANSQLDQAFSQGFELGLDN